MSRRPSKKKIVASLDAQSLRDAATMVRMYESKFNLAMWQAMYRLAWDLEKMIQNDFAYAGYVPGEGHTPSITVAPVVRKDGSGFSITAQGQQVGFLEFGAGIWSDYNHPLAQNVPYDVYMGSFSESEDGKGTWLKWLNDGKDPMKYPYNREARYAMLHAVEYIKEHAVEYIMEEIRRITI